MFVSTISDTDLLSVFLEHVGMSHDSAGGDDRFGGTKILTERPRALDGIHDLDARFATTLDVEPQHGAVHAITVVFVGDILLGERIKSGVVNL
jgi:hypothetical protein